MEKYKVSFLQLGSYNVPLEVLFTAGLEVEYVVTPPITKKTLEIGSKYSPDFVCSPFKYTLGNFIETIEAGANTLVQTGGVCRLGYYGELDEQILRDLGYNVRFINMAKAQYSKPITFYNEFKEINPNMSLKKIAKILPVVLKMVEYIDEVEDNLIIVEDDYNLIDKINNLKSKGLKSNEIAKELGRGVREVDIILRISKIKNN